MADGFGLRQKLDARIAAARRSLFWPALIVAGAPLALWVGSFLILWLSGVLLAAPLEAQAAAGVVFWFGLAIAAWLSLHRWRAPTDADARDLIDSAIEGRPLSTWTDRPARADTQTWALWSAHRDRLAALAARLGRINLRPAWKDADPFYLRLVVPALVIVAGLFAGPATLERLQRGLAPDFGALFGAHKLTVEAWITPPAYTGSAPFLLTSGEPARAPEGSEVTLRIISPGHPSVRIDTVDGPDATLRLRPGIDDAYEAKIEIERDTRLAVNFWGERANFSFSVIDDATPVIEFVNPPKMGEGDRTEFSYKLSDDYGVTRLELVARFANPPPGAEAVEELVPVEMVALEPKEEEGEYSQDLVRHRWAGLDVMVKLRATDASGAYGESAEVAYKLPQKLFLQPIARSAQEMRAEILREWRAYQPVPDADRFTAVKGTGFDAFAPQAGSRLNLATEGVKRAAMMIDAFTWKAEDYFRDPVVFMAFRHVRGLLDAAQTQAEAESSEGMLWDIALRAEYGSVADAKAALEAARRALEQALRSGASEEDIARLMDMFEQAVENYLAAQMAEALREGRVTEGQQQGGQQGGGQQLGDNELQRMLDALRDLSETGARDQARQLLSDMTRMLEQFENMQLQMSQGGTSGQQNEREGPLSRALNRALQETNRSLNDQRDLNDQTQQAQRDGGGPQRGQELADRQRQLRERLEEQMRSGGGQPQQGQQGQQGQGQQGQQGQQGEGQGEGQQGQQPGQQGEGGQQGQGQPGQGERADRGGERGGLGRPGAEGGGRLGQENERSRQLLGRAIDLQRRAEEALRNGDFEGARQFQQDAMQALQSRSGELARLADEADPATTADRNQRDILGRLNSGEAGFGDNVRIPDEMERQRARDILNEIRRRAGMRALTQEEQDYLRRLLERF